MDDCMRDGRYWIEGREGRVSRQKSRPEVDDWNEMVGV